jgi:hypothetical protein
MTNRFFFLTTYDSITGTALAALLNEHPDFACSISYVDPYSPMTAQDKPKSVNLTLDKFIISHTKPNKFCGNAQRFSAFELQYRKLMEKTNTPFRSVTVLLDPVTRINYLIYGWMKTNNDADYTVNYLEKVITSLLADKHPLYFLYNFNYFYPLVRDTILMKKIADLSVAKNKLFAIALAIVLAQDTANLPIGAKQFQFETLISDDREFLRFASYISNDQIDYTDAQCKALGSNLTAQKKILDSLDVPCWEQWQHELLAQLMQDSLQTIYYPHIDKSLAELYAAAGQPVAIQNNKPVYTKLISIQLNSNRPAQLVSYFDNIEETADDPSAIEVLINIDAGSDQMKALLDEQILLRKFTLKYIQTERPGSFCDLWKPINKLLAITDPDAYFLVNISDEMLFATQGWDTILKKYVGFFPDGIFRLRASRNKHRNYFDRWECSFAQDSIPITTKKWVDIGGDWNPCFGPDSYQQLISYYLAKEGKFCNTNYLRETPLTEIKFMGDVPAIGIDPEKSWRHNRDHIIAMQICQSYLMQLEARRRAVKLKANIIAYARHITQFTLEDDFKNRRLLARNTATKEVICDLDYKVSWLVINLTNQWRKLAFFSYFGDGRQNTKNIFRSFLQYLCARHILVRKLKSFLNLSRAKHNLKLRIKRFLFGEANETVRVTKKEISRLQILEKTQLMNKEISHDKVLMEMLGVTPVMASTKPARQVEHARD